MECRLQKDPVENCGYIKRDCCTGEFLPDDSSPTCYSTISPSRSSVWMYRTPLTVSTSFPAMVSIQLSG